MIFKRSFWLKWHWRIGIFSTLLLVIIALTGLVLNHARWMGLDHIMLDHPAVMKAYNMDVPNDYVLHVSETQQGFEVTTQDGDLYIPKPPAGKSVNLGQEIARAYRGQGLSLERVILDIHTGNIIGIPGKILADLSALAILFLSLSGFYNWYKRPRKK